MTAPNVMKEESAHNDHNGTDSQQILVEELREEVKKLSANQCNAAKEKNGFISSLCGCSLIPVKPASHDATEDDCEREIQSYDDGEYLLHKVSSWMSALSRRNHESDVDDAISDPGESQSNKEYICNKKVKFEDFPISSLRQVTRYTQEESKTLFFTEDELHQIELDRNAPSDDVEVMVSPPPSPTPFPRSSILRSPDCVTTIVDDVTIITKPAFSFKRR